MKKLLYIPVNSKPENISVSKTAGREFVNKFLDLHPEYQLIELDICNEFIPEPNHNVFCNRAETVAGEEYDSLAEDDKKNIIRIHELCTQFLDADVYVIAVPMWSVLFPSRLKRYLDCIILNNRVISVTPSNVEGLLNDKPRAMVYIQASGGVYPKIIAAKFNYGYKYIHDIFKFLGMKKVEKVLVEGTDIPDVGIKQALKKSFKDMDALLQSL